MENIAATAAKDAKKFTRVSIWSLLYFCLNVALLLSFPGISPRRRLPPPNPNPPNAPRYSMIAAIAGSSGTGKDNRIKSSMKETPFSRYLKAALGGLPLWPRSFCCQHFRRFVCDFIRSQNNSQEEERKQRMQIAVVRLLRRALFTVRVALMAMLLLKAASQLFTASSKALFPNKCADVFFWYLLTFFFFFYLRLFCYGYYKTPWLFCKVVWRLKHVRSGNKVQLTFLASLTNQMMILETC